jgi:UDP:flavonoid glycosyltransferase YjiC (YdhE family)
MTNILIWPDIYKEEGHWLPAVNMAHRLRNAGYNVVFMGIRDCERIVTPYGFRFRTILEDIYPLGYTAENNLEPDKNRWKPDHVLPIAKGALKSVIDSEQPDLLISGYFNALETLLLHYQHTLKFVTITTYLRHPSDDPAMFALTKLTWMSKPMARKVMKLANPEGEHSDIRRFVDPLDGALLNTPPEFIVCPREFDLNDERSEHLDNVQYIEPMVTRAPEVEPDNPKKKTVVLGTAGSQVEDYLDQARDMFDSLIEMMSLGGMQDYKLVLAMGPRLHKEFQSRYQNRIPDNIEFHVWVDQLKILDDAAVIFTQGGLATIKEAIWKRVPMVILPFGKDQADNALRVKKYGLGLTADSSQITAQRLRLLFTRASTSNWIGKKLDKMYGKFLEHEVKNPKFVAEIGKIVPA